MRNKRAGKAVAALAMGIVVAAGLVAVGAKESGPSLTYHELLVLAGDIFYLRDKVAPLTKFWKWASENYRQVLIVPGNHEYYNYSDVMERGLQ